MVMQLCVEVTNLGIEHVNCVECNNPDEQMINFVPIPGKSGRWRLRFHDVSIDTAALVLHALTLTGCQFGEVTNVSMHGVGECTDPTIINACLLAADLLELVGVTISGRVVYWRVERVLSSRGEDGKWVTDPNLTMDNILSFTKAYLGLKEEEPHGLTKAASSVEHDKPESESEPKSEPAAPVGETGKRKCEPDVEPKTGKRKCEPELV